MSINFPYTLLNRNQIIDEINLLASNNQAFLFIIDYKAESGFVIKSQDIDERFIRFEIESSILTNKTAIKTDIEWQTNVIDKADYATKFNYVRNEIHKGNSFLVNLTQATEVKTNLSLSNIFELSSAKYKLWLKDQFTVLSPETFIQIRNGNIASFPMKGTIDASLPNAESLILNDPKEKAEHATIVDLIRNDLSMVANNVEVKRYRYIDKLTTNKGELLQVSSEITGALAPNFHKKLGDILFTLLPAGSICGAPKPKTLDIIENAEAYERGFYTGICGWFDGGNLDSAVMIRYIEQQNEKLVFKSGGGITSQSDLDKEYEELIQKIYVPIY